MTFLWVPKTQRHGLIQPQANAALASALTKTSALLRLDQSTAVSAEWETVVDSLNLANPASQTDADRKPAVGTANGQPTAVFDGTDVWPWTIAANNNPTTVFELYFWIKPASVATRQRILHAGIAVSDNKIVVDYVISLFQVNFYRNATAGRQLTTTTGPTAGVWQFVRVSFNGAGATEADKMRVLVDEVDCGGTFADLGAGGTPTALNSAAGAYLIGAASNSDTPSTPLLNGTEIGPFIGIGNTALTATEAAALMRFLRPKA